METEPRSFADGLGFSLIMGHVDEERLIVGSSSGGMQEHVAHTQNDSLKLLEAMAAVLKLRATHYRHASLNTFLDYKILGLLVVKRTMALICHSDLTRTANTCFRS